MANDFYTRLLATLNTIPTPPPPSQEPLSKVPAPYRTPPPPKTAPLTAADFVWYIFRTRSPSPADITCAKHALRRCLQGNERLGWLIWDQAAGWRGASATWSEMHERDLRRLIKAHPPWSERTPLPPISTHPPWNEQTSAGPHKLAPTTRSLTIDQAIVKKMQSRIKQWLSECYGAPLSNPRWEALLRHTSANKAARYKIMQKAHAARLVPEITQDMLDALARTSTQAQEQLQKSHEQKQKRWRKRAQKLQQKREEAWRQHRRQARGVT